MELGQKIRIRRKQLDLRQADLAKIIGTSTGMISQYEVGGAMPSGAKLIEIAQALSVNVQWLIGSESKNFQDDALQTTLQIVKVPLISETQAGEWREIMDNFQPGDAEHWIETADKVSSNSFALRVNGNSMQDANNPRSIPDGAIVIVDPNLDPKSGDIVVARLNGSSTVKKFVIDGDNYYLTPLNPDYRPIVMQPPMEIIGVAKSARISL